MTLTTHTVGSALPVALIERLDEGRVKGYVVRAHVEWVREWASREETIEFFEALSPEVRRAATNTLASSWHPFATLIEIDRTIVSLFGNGRTSFVEELGRYSARRNLSAVVTLLERSDPQLFLRRTSLLHSQFQDFGRVAYRPGLISSGTMEHVEYTCFSPLYCASATGFYVEALRMHGRRDADVRETSCQCLGADACRFWLSWS